MTGQPSIPTLRAALTLVCLLLAGPSLAAALEGRVVRAEGGEPVAHAEVSVLGRPGSVRADAEGRFTLAPAPAPPFELLVVLPGERYMKPLLVESLTADEPLVVRVLPLVEETVTVTAGAAPANEGSPASGSTLVSRHDIETRQPVNLAQALESIAGVNKVSEGQAAVPAIRGLARGRTLILIDGARVTSERRVGPSATYLDPFSLEGIQVTRGPGSVAYGSDALGGVIHARTRRPVPGAGFGARLLGTLGAGEPQQRIGVELSQGFERGGILVQGHHRNLEDYDGPDGEVFNSGASDSGVLARGEHALGRGVLSLGWQSDLGRDIERPRNNSRVTRFYYPREDSHRLTAAYDVPEALGLDRVSLSAFVGSYRQTTDQDRFAAEDEPRRIERADVSARDYHLRAAFETRAGQTRIGFGADVNGRHGLEAEDVRIAFDLAGREVARTIDPTVGDAARTAAGLFASLETPLHARLSLSGGGRVDRVTTSNHEGFFGDQESDNASLSGYVAATAGPFGGLSFTAQVARGFRDPVLSDRYFRGVTGRGFITGNPELEPETSTQVDGAVRYTARRWRSALYLYEYRIHDLIERYDEGEDLFFFRNRGQARIRGVEVEAQAELPRGFTLDVAFQHQRGSTRDDDLPLDDLSPTSLSLSLRRSFAGRAFVQARTAFQGEDDRPGPTEIATPGYGLLDLSAGYAIDPRLELRLLARNLFDKAYPVSPDARAVVSPGRSALLTLLVDF